MPTTVVNRHHPGVPYDVYIGRGSDWGNPFSHLPPTQAQLATHQTETREQAVAMFEEWIFSQRHLLARLKELKGKALGCYCSPAACHGDTLARLADTTWQKDGRIILECSTKGDIRYSAFGAEIELFGVKATIEQHYQLSKRFLKNDGSIFTPKSVYDVKGKNSKVTDMDFCWIMVGVAMFPIDYRMEFYKLMWLMYLDQHPELVTYASRFDDYNDIFKGKSIICQADCIRQYIKQGRDSIVNEVIDFAQMLGIDQGQVFLGVWK